MLAARRRARDGYLLAFPSVLLCATGSKPTTIAAVLCCSRSRVYRTVQAYRAGTLGLEHDAQGRLVPPGRTTVLVPTLRRSLLALLNAPPRVYGWCRTRWSWATLALTLQRTRGITGSAETRRRWLHERGWVWKRAKLVAKADDPHRVARLARLRFLYEPLRLWETLVFADERDIHWLPKVGDAWMPKGTQVEVMTPGANEQHDLAGALEVTTGTVHHALGPRKTHAWFRELVQRLDDAYAAPDDPRLSVVGDHYQIYQAKAVAPWLATPPRVERLLRPTSCPRANPIERVFGDVQDLCTRHHTRQRRRELVADVVEPLHVNGPWKDKRSDTDHEPAVTDAVSQMAMEPILATAS